MTIGFPNLSDAFSMQSLFVAQSTTSLSVYPGPATSTRYCMVDGSGLFKWYYNDTTTANGSTVIAPSGGSIGRWKLVASLPAATEGLTADIVVTSNVASLSGSITHDDITPSNGSDVHLTAQTNPVENGLWTINTSGAWTRSTRWDSASDTRLGVIVRILRGTANGGSTWLLTSPVTGTITPGVTSQTWTKIANEVADKALLDGATSSAVVSTLMKRATSGNYTAVEKLQAELLYSTTSVITVSGLTSTDLDDGADSAGMAYKSQRCAAVEMGSQGWGHYKFFHGFTSSNNNFQGGAWTHLYGDARAGFAESEWIICDNGPIGIDGYDTGVNPTGRSITFDASTDVVTVAESHQLVDNQPVRLKVSGGTLPTAGGGDLAENTTYYVLYVSANTLKLRRTSGGAAIDITSAGSGTMTLHTAIERTPYKWRFMTGTNSQTGKGVLLEMEGASGLNLNSTSGIVHLGSASGKPLELALVTSNGTAFERVLGCSLTVANGATGTLFSGTELDSSVVPNTRLAECELIVSCTTTQRVMYHVTFMWLGGTTGTQANIFRIEDHAPTACFNWAYAGDAAAGTTLAESVIFRAPKLLTLETIAIEPAGAVTANGTNYGTITFAKRNGTGGGATTLGSLATDVAGGNWTAFTRKALTLSNTSLAANDIVTATITKAAAGVQLPQFCAAGITVGTFDRIGSAVSIADLGGGSNGGKIQIQLTNSTGGTQVCTAVLKVRVKN